LKRVAAILAELDFSVSDACESDLKTMAGNKLNEQYLKKENYRNLENVKDETGRTIK